jgi:hypothetical protein
MSGFPLVDDDPMLIAKKISLLKNINILKFDKCGLLHTVESKCSKILKSNQMKRIAQKQMIVCMH